MLGCMSFVAAERARLAHLLLELGPDAPTLCEGWATRDLAAHLLIRETKPAAAAGIVLPVGQQRLERETRRQLERDYGDVVREWAAGPPRFSPFAALDGVVNTVEYFVHHEDVRRGGGVVDPRDFSAVVSDLLYTWLRRIAPRLLAKSRVPVVLTAEGYPRVVCADRRGVAEQGNEVVRVTGDVGEVLLWVFGRDAIAASVEGNAELAR